MDAETVNQLVQINRKFYSEFSADFSDSRSGERFNIEPFRQYVVNETHVLDLGCGNGRLAETLEREGYMLDYLGVDGSADLIRFAGERRTRLKKIRAEFRVGDLTLPNWSGSLSATTPFDLVVSLAVLHHIPSFELRANVLRQAHTLLKPGSIFVLSNWQFTHSERLRKKIVEWNKIEIGDGRLETGDYLLDWKRGGTGYRYVHLLDKNEIERLAAAAGFQVIDQFPADNNLNLFSILQS